MGLTLVGVTTVATNASTDPQNFLLPVHGSTVVGDFLAVGVGTFNVSVTDPRLTEVVAERGAFGRATDLSDVTLTTTGMWPGLAMCATLRRTELGTRRSYSSLIGDYAFTTPLDGDGFVAGVAFVADADDTDNEVQTFTGWTDLGEVSAMGPSTTYCSLRGYFYDGTDPVPDLNPDDSSGGGGARLAFWSLWPAGGSTWLRQRQSPKHNPRISLHYPQLRQRQKHLS